MAKNSDSRLIYTNDDGSISIVCPSDKTDLTLEQIKAKESEEKVKDQEKDNDVQKKSSEKEKS